MKTLLQTSAIAALLMGAGTATFAQTMPEAEEMTCSDFSGLSVADQEIAVADIEAAKMEMDESAGSDMESDTDTAMDTEMDTDTDTAMDTDTDTAMDTDTDTAMDTDTDTTTESDMEADTETAMETDSDTETMASPPVQDLLAACEGNDEMLAVDAMGS